MIHELKTVPEYWQAVYDNKKNFEVRKDDREFSVGDTLILREWNPSREYYTGRVTQRDIIYMLIDPQYVKEGYVILGME